MTEGDPETDSTEPGDRDRFDQLYVTQFPSIYGYFLRRADRADVPDLVAEVFATAWRRRADVPPKPHDRLWLYGVARKVMSGHWRSSQRRQRLLARVRREAEPTTNVWAGTDRRSEELHTALSTLRAQDRELVRLIVWEQLSHAEAAVVLGCSANAVAIRWHRSLRRLRRHLGASKRVADASMVPSPPAPIPGETQ